MNDSDKRAAEKHIEAARAALVVTEKGIADLLAAGAHINRAAPFITAAAAGLAARNMALVPENFAAEAVRLGLAVDLLVEKLDREEEPDSEESALVVHFHTGEAGNLSPEKIREIIQSHLEDLATTPTGA